MAEALSPTWRVSEIATCPICLEDFQRPKSLPCVHSFCLHCLQGHFKDKRPGDDVLCPVCRDKFKIPKRAMSVVKTLSGSDMVVGLTSLNQELFVLHLRDVNQVDVYSTNSSTLYTHLRQFSINGLSKHDANDMTSCVRRKCLYISDCSNKCVRKVALNGDVTAKLPMFDRPAGLSLTPSGNLLVTCHWSGKLVELNSETGQPVREIDLRQSDIRWPLHAVQLADHRYVVSHVGGRHRVCAVDVDGKVPLSYGRRRGSDVTQLDLPRHVIIDRDNFIFVADCNNDRLALLTDSLQLSRYVKLEQRPLRLYLDHGTRRVYVGHWNTGDVTVIQV